MTGYGLQNFENSDLAIKCEAKSLNSKYLDLSIKLPRQFSDHEFEIRELTGKILERGKINLQIEIHYKQETRKKLGINKELALAYYKELYEVARQLGAPDGDVFRMTMQMPEVITGDTGQESIQEEWKLLLQVVRQALEHCDTFRIQEGHVLSKEFKLSTALIRQLLAEIAVLDPLRVPKVKERIWNNLEKSDVPTDQVDKNRFEQEIIYYLEKFDITEEKVRLSQHLDFFEENLSTDQSNGKKLGFIAQEIGREINTIGSKANDAAIQRKVVGMKEELEKIKEQLMNIL